MVWTARWSSGADPVPVKLLLVAAHPEVVEHRFHFQLDLGLAAVRLAIDPNISLALEVDQFGAEPDIKPGHASDVVQPDQIGERARFHLDRGGIQVAAQHLDGPRGRGEAGVELADDHAVEPIVRDAGRIHFERLGVRVAAMAVHPVECRADLLGQGLQATPVVLNVGDVPRFLDQRLDVLDENELAGRRGQIADHEEKRHALVMV